ncbi:MAG: metalloregulator ArsR/SmtB family transcription factor [Clostridiaceae bacterium]
MDSIRFLPINYRLEAASVLCRLAYRGDEPRAGEMRAAADHYSRKYGVPFEVFDGLIETYEYVKSRIRIDEAELLTLFGQIEGFESNLHDQFLMLENSLGKTRVRELKYRIATVIADDDEEPDFEGADLAALMDYAQKLTAPDDAKWLLVDACIRYDEYRARLDRVLDLVEPLVREKADLLEPYAKAALGEFCSDLSGHKLFSHLSESGLRLDCTKADVYPYLFHFSSIMLYSNVVTATHFGEEEQTFLAYGVLIDRINSSSKSGRDAVESMLSLLHALDDKRRLEILTALKNRSLYGQELVAITGLSAATISHHMSELGGAGLVSIEKQGVKLLYHLNTKRLSEMAELIQQNFLD